MATTARTPADRADLVLWALGAAILTNVWRIQDIVKQLAPLRPAIGAILAAAFLLLIDRSPERRARGWMTPVTIPLVAFLALTLLVIPGSLDPQLSMTFYLTELLPTAVLGWMVAIAVRNGRDLEWLVLMHVLGAALYGIYALVRVPIVQPEGHWIRIVFYDNNDFALVAVSTIPLALYLLQSGRERLWRIAGGLALAILLLCVVRSGSRGGLIGLTAVFGYLALRHRAVAPRGRLAVMLLGAVAVAVFGRGQLASTIATLRNPKADYNWGGNEYTGRVELWKRGVGYMRDRPLTGVGLAAFPIAEGELSEVARQRMAHGQEVKQLVAHNMYIQVGAELGVVVLGVFIWLLWRCYATCVAVARAYEPTAAGTRRSLLGMSPETTLPRLLAASIIGFCVSSIFIAAAYLAYFQILVGLAGALARVVPEWVTARQRRPLPQPEWAETGPTAA